MPDDIDLIQTLGQVFGSANVFVLDSEAAFDEFVAEAEQRVICNGCGRLVLPTDAVGMNGDHYDCGELAVRDDKACGGCGHSAHWRPCQQNVVGVLGTTYRCECRRRGPSGS